VIGEVGSGKSGLLLALAGELPYFTGRIALNGRVAYVEQEPVILSGTVRENILFLSDFDPQLYERAVEWADLRADFEQLPLSDRTLVGEKGVTLSGGQKARVALARALYAQADIYLLDDPLSAVDAKVARQLLDRCVLPLARTATVLLATHQLQFLYSCDCVLVMEGGRVARQGSPKHILPLLEDLRSPPRHPAP
jgi:ABC-type multidrug transport system fused ATPase/permease subunit